jgi:methenyltetrahydromethanopterin cyclohydrolase
MEMNLQASKLVQRIVDRAEMLNVCVQENELGTRIVDCGVHVPGGLQIGTEMAEICLAGAGQVVIDGGEATIWPGPWVSVRTDQPVAACMASQYAGWPVSSDPESDEKYFAMASGPMRSVRGREPLFEEIGCREQAQHVVGVLESGQLPPSAICQTIAEQCQVPPNRLTLLVAPTASLAGTVQVVARSVETALHKMLELGFDHRTMVAGFGTAPLPPVAADDLTGIGWTNDSVLYAARVTIWMQADDSQLAALGERVPSCSSPDYGRPFAEIFRDYDHDFYKIDPMLFSPAVVEFVNLSTGHLFRFGQTDSGVLKKSFGIA